MVFGKARIKESMFELVKGMMYLVITLVITVIIIKGNAYLIQIIEKAMKAAFPESMGLYTQIRNRAYDLNATIGTLNLILYGILVWYTIKFAIMYISRLINVLIMALIGILVPIISTYQKIIKGSSDVQLKWFKEMTFGVFIQTLHALTYFVFAAMALSLSETTGFLVGAVLILMLMKSMFEFTKTLRKMFGMEKGTMGIISGKMDEADPLSVMNNISNMKFMKDLGKRIKTPEDMSERIDRIKAKGVAGIYNTYQRVNDFKDAYNAERPSNTSGNSNSAPKNVDNNGNPNMNTTSEQRLSPEAIQNFDEVLEKNQVEMNNEIYPQGIKDKLFENISEKASNIKNRVVGEFNNHKRVFDSLDMDKYVYTDENGRKRMLAPELYYDKETGKFKEKENGALKFVKDYEKKYKKMNKKVYEERKKNVEAITNILKSSLKVGVQGTIALAALPAFLVEGKAATAVIYGNFFGKTGKEFMGNLKNAKSLYDKHNEKNDTRTLIGRVRDKRRNIKISNKLDKAKLVSDKIEKEELKLKEKIKNANGDLAKIEKYKNETARKIERYKRKIERLEKAIKLKYNGVAFTSINQAINLRRKKLLIEASKYNSADLGNIRLGVTKANSKYKGATGRITERRRAINRELTETANIGLEVQRSYVRDEISKVAGANISDKQFSQMHTQSLLDAKMTIMPAAKTSKVLKEELAFKNQRLTQVYNDSSLNQLDKTAKILETKKQMDNLTVKMIEKDFDNYTVEELLSFDENKMNDEIEKSTRRIASNINSSAIKTNDDIKAEVKVNLYNKIQDLYSFESETRESERRIGISYNSLESKYQNLDIEKLKQKDVKDLRISDLEKLRNSRIEGLIEAERLMTNMMTANDLTSSAHTFEEIEFANEYAFTGDLFAISDVTGDKEEFFKRQNRLTNFRKAKKEGRRKTRK